MTTIHPTNDISTTIISTTITRWLQRERWLHRIQWGCIVIAAVCVAILIVV
jgi:hypothetical protein